MRKLSLALFSLVLFACDGTDEPGFTPTPDTNGTLEDTSHLEDTQEDTYVPLDTALPDIGVDATPDADYELRNGTQAWVRSVIDGDTVKVSVGNFAPKTYTIRFGGLAAPECLKVRTQTPGGQEYACTVDPNAGVIGSNGRIVDQDSEFYGYESYLILKELVEGKNVKISCDKSVGEICPDDYYDRKLAYLEIDGKNVSVEMARLGGGFSYTDYASQKRAAICKAEDEARNAKRGMWGKYATTAELLKHMNQNTQSWYRQRDTRCSQATGN